MTKYRFKELLDFFSDKDISKWTVPFWNGIHNQLIQEFQKDIPDDFLNHPLIAGTMVVNSPECQAIQLKYLESQLDEYNLTDFLQEPALGKVPISCNKYFCSHSAIQHLYHLLKLHEVTKLPEGKSWDTKVIVEVGGGYGRLCSIWRKINPKSTYIIYDVPFFSCLQNYYLGEINQKDYPNILVNTDDKIIEGKINIIPMVIAENIKAPEADILVSFWALSETNLTTQQWVASKNNWFNAKRIVLAYQKSCTEFPNAESIIKKIPTMYTKTIQDTEYVKDNSYCWAIKNG